MSDAAMMLTRDNARDIAAWAAGLGDTRMAIHGKRLRVIDHNGRTVYPLIGDWVICLGRGQFRVSSQFQEVGT